MRGNLLGHGVDDIVERPVKHLDQEGELLQDATVQVSGESRGVQRNPPDGLSLSEPCGLLVAVGLTYALVVGIPVGV